MTVSGRIGAAAMLTLGASLVGCGSDDDKTPRVCVARMDDAWGSAGQGADPTVYYGSYGLTFDNVDGYGLIGGMGNGDPGNWDIDGTNGTAAWGLWPGTHGITFPEPVRDVSLDFLRGFNDYTFTVTAYLQGSAGQSEFIALAGAFDSDTATFAGPLDEVRWTLDGFYGVDDLRYTVLDAACPP